MEVNSREYNSFRALNATSWMWLQEEKPLVDRAFGHANGGF